MGRRKLTFLFQSLNVIGYCVFEPVIAIEYCFLLEQHHLSVYCSMIALIHASVLASCFIVPAERVRQEKLNIVCVPTSFQVSLCDCSFLWAHWRLVLYTKYLTLSCNNECNSLHHTAFCLFLCFLIKPPHEVIATCKSRSSNSYISIMNKIYFLFKKWK